MTEAQTIAQDIYDKFKQISIGNETYIPPILTYEMSQTAVDLLIEYDSANKDLWNEVKLALIFKI